MTRKIITIITIATIICTSVVGCTSNTSENETTTKATPKETTTEEVTTEEPTTDVTKLEGYLGVIWLPISTVEYTGEDIIIEKGYVFDISKLFPESFTSAERAAYTKEILRVIKDNSFGNILKFNELYWGEGYNEPVIKLEDNLVFEYTGEKKLRLKFFAEFEKTRAFDVIEE